MKFLVDAHLPASLCVLLRTAGHEANHTSQLPRQNQTTDQDISAISRTENSVVVTKDTDFFYAMALRQGPHKLLLVRTGNIGVAELKNLFQKHLASIVSALENNMMVELDRTSVRIIL